MVAGPRHFSIYDAPFWQSAEDGALRLQRCTSCGRWRFPPGAACPRCLSTEAEWAAVSGKGALLSWTTFHRQYLPAYPAPVTCVAVQLAEGPILIGNIDREEVGALQADMPIFLSYGRHPDGYVLPRFSIDPEKAKRPVPPPAAAKAEATAAPRAPAKAAKRAKAPAKRSAAKAKPSKAKASKAAKRSKAKPKTAAARTVAKKIAKKTAKKTVKKASRKAAPSPRGRAKARNGRSAKR